MRLPLLLTIIVSLIGANTAQARLFWQTYGSIVPSVVNGEGCTRNANQDYFVPRHCDSCRYGLFSPCKKSCTNSPACWWCHPLYPGYCSVYGPCWFHRRDHVHCCYCGCDPVKPYYGPWRKCCHGHHEHHGCHLLHSWHRKHGCRSGCESYGGCGVSIPYHLVQRLSDALPNVEPPDFEVLGSLPVPGDELLASIAVSTDEDPGELPGVTLPRTSASELTLPSLGRPATEHLP